MTSPGSTLPPDGEQTLPPPPLGIPIPEPPALVAARQIVGQQRASTESISQLTNQAPLAAVHPLTVSSHQGPKLTDPFTG